jgi:hypothetical protein
MKINSWKTLAKKVTATLFAVFLSLNMAKSEVIFTENFEDGSWNGFSPYPAANTAVLNSGDTIYGAPATGEVGTYIVAPEGSKLGKMWPLYWSPGNVTTSNSIMYDDWYDTANGWVPYLQGQQMKLSMDLYISSYDQMQATTDVAMYAKFFNQDYSYYYDWASVIMSVKNIPLDTWTYRELVVTVPNDVSVIQFGLEMSQLNYSSGSINVDNIVLQTVPEPSSLSLMLGAGILIGIMNINRRKN